MPVKVPAGLSELALEPFREREIGTGQLKADDVIDPLAGALKLAREQATSLSILEQAALGDPTITEAAGALQLANAALRAGERVAMQLDAARARARAEIDRIDKRVTTPPPPRDALALQFESEIRARLASMPPKERDDAISAAFSSKTEQIINAIVRAPAMLTGLPEARHAVLRHRYAEAFHPGAYERKQRLTKALDTVDRLGDLFVGVVRSAADTEKVRLANAARNQREAAMAAFKES